jgi:hypothetical protein
VRRCKFDPDTDQWYLDMKGMAAAALAAVDEGRTTFVPANWRNGGEGAHLEQSCRLCSGF